MIWSYESESDEEENADNIVLTFRKRGAPKEQLLQKQREQIVKSQIELEKSQATEQKKSVPTREVPFKNTPPMSDPQKSLYDAKPRGILKTRDDGYKYLVLPRGPLDKREALQANGEHDKSEPIAGTSKSILRDPFGKLTVSQSKDDQGQQKMHSRPFTIGRSHHFPEYYLNESFI